MFASCCTARRGFEVHVYNLNEAFARAQVDPSCGSIISRTYTERRSVAQDGGPNLYFTTFHLFCFSKSLDKQTVQKA